MPKSQKLLSQPYLKNRNMFVDAVDSCIGICCEIFTCMQEVRFFLMFPAINPFSFPKTVERRYVREWSMAMEDSLQIQDDDLRPIEDDL